MERNTKKFVLLIVACSTVGVILGGTASWAQSNQCWNSERLTNQCLNQDPVVSAVQGMSVGLIAGAGAALGATWQIKQKD